MEDYSYIKQIIKHLEKVPFSSEEIYNEMLDHYSSAYEVYLEEGIDKSEALAKVIEEIEKEDYSSLKSNNKMKKLILSSAILVVLLVAGLYTFDQLHTSGKYVENLSSNIEIQTSFDQDPPYGSPLEYSKITSDFGERTHPIHKKTVFHKGTDFAAPLGTKIISVEKGIVTKAAYDKKYGYYVEIKHDDIYTTRYHHMKSISVVKGQSINKGEKIGEVGNSGLSTAPHLHYEIIKSGSWVDVADYLKA